MLTRWLPPEPTGEDIAAGVLMLAPFVLAVAVLIGAQPVRPEQVVHADPYLRSIGGPGVVAIAGVGIGAGWLWRRFPGAASRRRALRGAFLGAALAVGVAVALRLLAGPSLPAFVPPEESAKPGLTQGLAAGVGEELLFRLVLLPAVYAGLRRRLSRWPAVLVASLLVGLAFAVMHELPPAGGTWLPRFLATRTLFPGLVMSVAFLVHPAFLLVAHASAHVIIPQLFV